jgi:hypothetical protein
LICLQDTLIDLVYSIMPDVRNFACFAIINSSYKFIRLAFLLHYSHQNLIQMKLSNFCLSHASSKFFLTTSIFLMCSIYSTAQTSVAVAPNKMNVLYIGVDNPVSIAAYDATEDKVVVTINGGGGAISKVNSGSYIVRVNQITDDCAIQVNVDGKPAGTSKFRVRTLPTPMATVGGFPSGSNIPADAFKKQAGLGAYLKDFPFEVRNEIVSYAFALEDDKGGVIEVNNEGSAFTAQTKQYIEQYLKPGKTVTVDKIRANSADGRVIKLPALVYYIK